MEFNQNMPISIHQFVSSFSPRDAVGNIIFAIRKTLRDAGYVSEIYAENIHPELENEANLYTEFEKKNSNNLLIYHHGFASNLVDFLLPLNNRIILVYHNITPAHFFKGVDDQTANGCTLGREQLDLLKNKSIAAFCFSRYSETELKQKGFKKTFVVTPILNLKGNYGKNVEFQIKSSNDMINIISVGRVVPHKKLEDLLKVFACYNECINKNSHLFLIGKYNQTEPYYQWLQSVIKTLNLKNVNFFNDVTDKDLKSYYDNASIYLSMSEHEGFCLPIVEGMLHHVPILAYGAAAIPETLGDGGILLKEKKYREIAEMIQIVVEDEKIKNKIIENQENRLRDLDPNIAQKEFLKQIEHVLNTK